MSAASGPSWAERNAGAAALGKIIEPWLQTPRRSALVPYEAALYREQGRAAAGAGHVHLQLLMLDDEPIAHNLGCIQRGTYYYLKTQMCRAPSAPEPRHVPAPRVVERMIARGLPAIDFCGTPYEWEQQWTDT